MILTTVLISLCVALDNGVGLLPPMVRFETRLLIVRVGVPGRFITEHLLSNRCTDDYVECFDDYCDEKEIKGNSSTIKINRF